MDEQSRLGYVGNIAAGTIAALAITLLLISLSFFVIVLAGIVAGLIARGAARGAIAGAVSGAILSIAVIIFAILGTGAMNVFTPYSSYSTIISSDLSLVSYLTGLGNTAMYIRLVVFGVLFQALGGTIGGFLLPHSVWSKVSGSKA